jgi:hypothetical protein
MQLIRREIRKHPLARHRSTGKEILTHPIGFVLGDEMERIRFVRENM